MAPLSEFPRPEAEDPGALAPEIRVPPPGPMSRAATDRLERVECPAHGSRRERRQRESETDMTPIVLASARGSNVYDVDGNRYVDLAAGFGSVSLGHGAPSLLRSIEAQASRLIQGLGDVYSADLKIALLERIAALHPGEGARVILTQSGSDAVTAAIKTAALATGRPGLVAFEGSYHGLGYAPLAGCGYRESFRAPFSAQLNPHVRFAPYAASPEQTASCLEALERCLAAGDVGAVLFEPILGRGGCVVPPDEFARGVSEIARRHGALVIADEVWTGLGRSGSMVRSAAIGMHADILCFGKALGGGMPISACVAPFEIMRAWAENGEVLHTSTHAGAPLACSAAIATLDSLRFRKLASRAREVGDTARAAIHEHLKGARGYCGVRGAGLMIGLELASGDVAQRAVRGLLERGYLVVSGGPRGETLTLTPPLSIPEELLVGVAPRLREVLER